ncbi:Nitronate monooxygenase-like protein 1 [Elsinoe fawcettii]|nr:Nitronate monooxygenase-like protein 1 [Elsinoe fawcettii]
MASLLTDYPWVKGPLISAAPMRLIALAPLAVAVSAAGGLGFIGAGSDVSFLEAELKKTRDLLSKLSPPPKSSNGTLPVGVGFLCWGLKPADVTPLISSPDSRPAAIWLFAPRELSHLAEWSSEIRKATENQTKVWIQIGTVAEALAATEYGKPDVLVVQGQDAGGHGLTKGAGLIPLLPEVIASVSRLASEKSIKKPTFVATGGIMEGKGVAAALTLGAQGICFGTRFLAAEEANLTKGYRDSVIRARDGGVSTARSSVYDTLRGTTDWPKHYGGRGVLNASYHDWEKGMPVEENKKLYDEALKKGDEGWDESNGRLTTYAGTGVGLVDKVQPAAEIVKEAREGAVDALRQTWESVQGT